MREEKESTIGLKLLAVALAVTAWVALTVEKPENLSDKTVEASVRYENSPDLILISSVESVTIGVRGPESKIGKVNSNVVEVFVELTNPGKGVFDVPLTHENVILPDEDVEVTSIDPNIIRLELDREARRLIPVKPSLDGEPAAGALVQHAEVVPPNVLVRGPESVLQQLTTVTTTPIQLTGHALDFEEQGAVLPPGPMVSVVQPAVVTVRIHMVIPGTETGNDEAQE